MTLAHDSHSPATDSAIRWLEDHGDALFAYALSRVRHPDVAEDLVQEALLAAIGQKENFLGVSTERTWLIGILRHKLIDYLRRALRERPINGESESVDGLAGMFDRRGHWKVSPQRWAADPQALAEREEFRAVLKQCLSRLPARMAQTFWLHEAEDVTTAELCEQLNLTAANAWALLHRARIGLRKCLSMHWFDGEQPR